MQLDKVCEINGITDLFDIFPYCYVAKYRGKEIRLTGEEAEEEIFVYADINDKVYYVCEKCGKLYPKECLTQIGEYEWVCAACKKV